MLSTRLRKLALTFIFAFGALHAHSSQAGVASAGSRLFANLGPWSSNFKQSDGSHETQLSSMMSAAIQAQLGIDLSVFFIEYNLSWLISAYSANPKERDASYFSPLGFNAGINLPLLPVEFYVGGEKGTYSLKGGISPSYDGLAIKGGINLVFHVPGTSDSKVGLKAEIRRFYGKGDDAGSFPEGFTTSADTYFVGMTFGRSN